MCLFLSLQETELVRGNELSSFLKSPLSDTFLCPLEMSRSLSQKRHLQSHVALAFPRQAPIREEGVLKPGQDGCHARGEVIRREVEALQAEPTCHEECLEIPGAPG